jgi:hypothetical protein
MSTLETEPIKEKLSIVFWWRPGNLLHKWPLVTIDASAAPAELAALFQDDDFYRDSVGTPTIVLGQAILTGADGYAAKETYTVDGALSLTAEFRGAQKEQAARDAERAAKQQAREDERRRNGELVLEQQRRQNAADAERARLDRERRDPEYLSNLERRLAALEGR